MSGDMDQSTSTTSKSWIKLNVGGKLFLTTSQTLNRVPNSFFSRLIDENSELNSDKVSGGRFSYWIVDLLY